MYYPIYFIFGISPSIIWLLFYLKRDIHPEPKRMLLKVFLFGMLSAFPILLLEIGFQKGLTEFSPFLPSIATLIIGTFIGVALIEETVKYLVVQGKALKHKECDEPIDIMIYMIVAALGFAAIENILYVLPCSLGEAFYVTVGRFLGATFLHALCSATVGYFLALACFSKIKKRKLIFLGLGISTTLHGLYNSFIIKEPVISIIILIFLVFFVSYAFKKLSNFGEYYKNK